MNKRMKQKVIYVKNEKIEEMKMEERIVVMNKGKIKKIGEKIEIYDRKENKFVEGFIGQKQMRLIKGKVEDGFLCKGEGEKIEVQEEEKGEREEEEGIRKENLVIEREGEGMKIVVEVIEKKGKEKNIYGRIEGEKVREVLRERIKIEKGEKVNVKDGRENINIFDKERGLKI